MDQIKIGRFIADERKRKGYTQKQLSEKLEISDKTISKWERGNGFPEVSLLLPLCNELEITVNELLSGERVSEEDYLKKAEENMVNLVREAQESKKKIILSAMAAGLTIIAAVRAYRIMLGIRFGSRSYNYCCSSIVSVVRNACDGELGEDSAYNYRFGCNMWRNCNCVYS